MTFRASITRRSELDAFPPAVGGVTAVRPPQAANVTARASAGGRSRKDRCKWTPSLEIATPVGTMRGDYFCVAEDGERFEAPVPEFILRMPRTLH